MKRRGSYFQFNNRNINFGKYSAWQRAPRLDEFRGESKTWKVWPQKPTSPAATSSFAAVNPRQPFIPKPPVNLIITIPNFSGACPPDLFEFRNSSAKSVKFTTSAPASAFPQSSSCLPAIKDAIAGPMKSNEIEINDDVQYLFTVQTKGGELVEVVDLSEDLEGPNCSDFRASDQLLPSNSIASSDVKECSNDRRIPKMPEKEAVPISEKQNAAQRKGLKRKKSSEDLHCDICESEYEFVRSRGEEIFKARCGHVFCQLCLKELDPYKCPYCNIYLQKLFKVFL
ncbi:hypothetical protein AVEN_134942-1 [Araneus ventricosus]|uniref:RING-type domain-containing protein n=1 Tax=Araneus ventricosus TaxID=182803 RepID=A0A4Y2CH26_ARAVE|nr:hypothetical protein AVEN_134942-1 [Araneus ventricosus]